MNVKHALPYVAARNPVADDDALPIAEASLLAGAEKEMGAFLCAVQRKLGLDASRRAGHYWIDAFESAVRPARPSTSVWRRITIAAASRLAQENLPTC